MVTASRRSDSRTRCRRRCQCCWRARCRHGCSGATRGGNCGALAGARVFNIAQVPGACSTANIAVPLTFAVPTPDALVEVPPSTMLPSRSVLTSRVPASNVSTPNPVLVMVPVRPAAEKQVVNQGVQDAAGEIVCARRRPGRGCRRNCRQRSTARRGRTVRRAEPGRRMFVEKGGVERQKIVRLIATPHDDGSPERHW